MGSAIAGSALLGGMASLPEPIVAKKHKNPIVLENGKYDLLLKGGHVIDPANSLDIKKTDIAVTKGRIALVDKNIPAEQAKKTIDVSGLYVTPGLIDIHAHVFYTDDNPT